MSENKNAMQPVWVDPDDAPELTDAFFERADEYIGDRLIHRGRGRSESQQVAVTVLFDAEVVRAFQTTGKDWQARMNAALKDWLKTHSPA